MILEDEEFNLMLTFTTWLLENSLNIKYLFEIIEFWFILNVFIDTDQLSSDIPSPHLARE